MFSFNAFGTQKCAMPTKTTNKMKSIDLLVFHFSLLLYRLQTVFVGIMIAPSLGCVSIQGILLLSLQMKTSTDNIEETRKRRRRRRKKIPNCKELTEEKVHTHKTYMRCNSCLSKENKYFPYFLLFFVGLSVYVFFRFMVLLVHAMHQTLGVISERRVEKIVKQGGHK